MCKNINSDHFVRYKIKNSDFKYMSILIFQSENHEEHVLDLCVNAILIR
jgi:hypothetical protein